MQMKDLFRAQLDRETAATRKMAERFPEGKGEWKPHREARHVMIADTFSHLAHRGQLSVYLRLNGRPVPSVYGPTADEGWQQ